MREYHKIQSIYKRDEKTHKFIDGEYSLPEFAYLANNVWVATEKIDGTNIRIGWDGTNIEIGGRTANAQIPTFLLGRLNELFTTEKLKGTFTDLDSQAVLFGEGYGARIQKGGGNYIPDGVDFILFDVMVGDWWLKREDVEGIAQTLGIKVVPIINEYTLPEAVERIKSGVTSTFGYFELEGFVLRPKVELKARNGSRIITKVKGKDF